MITVTCRKRDIAMSQYPKYENLSDYNVTTENPVLPNGVYGYRHLRRTNPQETELSPLAQWIVKMFDGCVFAGINKQMYGKFLMVYNGKTEADLMREEAKKGSCGGTTWFGPNAVENAMKRAENFIKCYDLETKPAYIDQYLFPIIEPNESDDQYWNRVANELIKLGSTKLVFVDRNSNGVTTKFEYNRG